MDGLASQERVGAEREAGAAEATVAAPTPAIVPALFLSDIHLGSPHCQAASLTRFLDLFQPRRLYLVGDFIDVWRLQRLWYWNPDYQVLLDKLGEYANWGTQFYYTPGNHDECLRPHEFDLGGMQIADEFVHETQDGRRLLIIHGDRFDVVEQYAWWISFISCRVHDKIHGVAKATEDQQQSLPSTRGPFDRTSKWLVRVISRYERRSARYAAKKNCMGVVCGHVHRPKLRALGDVLYANAGDWVESMSALVEQPSGELQLIRVPGVAAWQDHGEPFELSLVDKS